MSKPTPRFSDDTLEAQLFRLDQASIDADIEGVAPDPEGEALLRRLVAEGVPGPERRARLIAHIRARHAKALAAE